MIEPDSAGAVTALPGQWTGIDQSQAACYITRQRLAGCHCS